MLDEVENIILFAYSEIVTTFLGEYGKHHPSWKEQLKLFVLECSGKRRLTSNNNIEYSDGLYYALQLSKHNFNSIELLPDTSFSSLAYDLKEKDYLFSWDSIPGSDNEKLQRYLRDDLHISWADNTEISKSRDGKTIQLSKEDNSAEIMMDAEGEKATLNISGGNTHELTVKKDNGKLNIYKANKSLVLFGVNGIDKSGDCKHTSGHLMIAIVAKYFKIPVKVIADSFKIGTIEWNPTAKRDTPWLTGEHDMLSDIKKHNIKLTNFLEDRIPKDLITKMITDK